MLSPENVASREPTLAQWADMMLGTVGDRWNTIRFVNVLCHYLLLVG